MNLKNGRCSANLSRTIFLSNQLVDMFLNVFHLIFEWIFSSLSRWVLTFNNQLTSTSTYLISYQKMPIRSKSFLQCSCSNKSRHIPSNSSIPFFLKFFWWLSETNPSEVIQTTCIVPGTQYGKKVWIFCQNPWSRFSYNSYTFHPLAVIGESAK